MRAGCISVTRTVRGDEPGRAWIPSLVAMAALVALVTTACASTKAATPVAGAAAAQDADFTCPEAAATAGAATPLALGGRPLAIATTVAPLTSIVANVAGDHATVT